MLDDAPTSKLEPFYVDFLTKLSTTDWKNELKNSIDEAYQGEFEKYKTLQDESPTYKLFEQIKMANIGTQLP